MKNKNKTDKDETDHIDLSKCVRDNALDDNPEKIEESNGSKAKVG